MENILFVTCKICNVQIIRWLWTGPIGFRRAGWRGLIIADMCFIVPAMLIVLAFAWAYARFGSTPQAAWLLYGIIPVIIAVVFQAVWTLARQAV